jgi:hypothetical protein
MKRTSALGASAMWILLAARPASAQDLQPPAPEGAENPDNAAPLPPVKPVEESGDSGLGLEWVYITAGGGGAYTNMSSLSASNLQVQQSTSTGGEFDVGAGVRLFFLSVGVRARDLQLSAFNLWELDAEAALHMRIWHIDPYFGARGGYVTVGGLNSGSVAAAMSAGTNTTSDVNVHGFNVGPMFGIDVYFSSLFSVGAEVNAEFLILERPPVAIPSTVQMAQQASGVTLTPQQQALYNQSGSSVGLGVVGGAHLGIHF